MTSAAPEDRDALHSLCMADPLWAERYEGWHELGQGASATVVRTRCNALGEDIALKVFYRLSSDDWKRFQQEVRNAQLLSSPFVVRTYSPFPRGALSWIELELVEGPSLRQELERRAREDRPFDLEQARDIAVALTRALVAAHESGLIHRDVKPANVLLPHSRNPAAKLGDFGISRLTGAGRLTKTGLLAGTPQFAAPEVIAGQAAEAASDVYSLSLCLYLLFSNNRFPFDVPDDASAAQWMKAHTDQAALPIGTFRPDVPLSLEALLERGLAKDPRRRPTAAEFLEALVSLRREPPGRSVPVDVRSDPRRRAAVAVGVLLLGGLLSWRALSGGGENAAPDGPSPSAAAPPALSVEPTLPARPPVAPAVTETAGRPGPPARAPVERVSFQASLQGDLLKIVNAGDDSVADLSIALVGAGGERYASYPSGRLAAGQELFLALDSFTPSPPEGFRAVQVEITPGGGARTSRRIVLRLN